MSLNLNIPKLDYFRHKFENIDSKLMKIESRIGDINQKVEFVKSELPRIRIGVGNQIEEIKQSLDELKEGLKGIEDVKEGLKKINPSLNTETRKGRFTI